MANRTENDSMLEMFIFETAQYLERLEELVLSNEELHGYSSDVIGEIFRIMHNIKSSSAMMSFHDVSQLTHKMEDFFLFLRDQKQEETDCAFLPDLILEYVDFLKVELHKIKCGCPVDGDITVLLGKIEKILQLVQGENIPGKTASMKKEKKQDKISLGKKGKKSSSGQNAFRAIINFHEDCGMENIRAYQIVHQLQDFVHEIFYYPEKLMENEDNIQIIQEQGFEVFFITGQNYDAVLNFFNQNVLFKNLELIQVKNDHEFRQLANLHGPGKSDVGVDQKKKGKAQEKSLENKIAENTISSLVKQSIIGVNVEKLDKLMDLVGEMVISEAMVTQHQELKGLELVDFHKAARQLRKIINEVRGFVMSMRMVPLATSFQKMRRVVRDMSKSLQKEVELEISGEETEVDKNIIEHISDPLLHLVRNALDHGLESEAERKQKGKTETARITLEARNAGNDVLVIVRDNGRGLDREKILKHAQEKGLLFKAGEEMTDREIYNLIFAPGFSTKEQTTEFSGRGVGMDVVTNNIAKMGGEVLVDSVPGQGTTITLKIPLTLTIINGMSISVGQSSYIIPINTIKECFRPKETAIIMGVDGQEMIMVRGQCIPIIRLHQEYAVKTSVNLLTEGILVMVENNENICCLFADALLGECQVVFKPLPELLRNNSRQRGLAGCTLLGDGSISLILDVAGFV